MSDLVVGAVAGVVFLLVVRYLWLVRQARAAVAAHRVPVVPHFIPWLGQAIAFGQDRATLLKQCADAWGHVFQLTLAGQTLVVIADADLFRMALRTPATTAGMADVFAESIASFYSSAMSKDEAYAAQACPVHMKSIRTEIQAPVNLAELTRRAQAEIDATVRPWSGTKSLRESSSVAIFRASVAALYGPSTVKALCDDDRFRRDIMAFDWGLNDKVKKLPAFLSANIRNSEAAMTRILAERVPMIRQSAEKSALIEGVSGRISARVEEGIARNGDQDTGMIVMLWAAIVNSMNAIFYVLYWVARDPKLQAAIRAEALAVAEADGSLSLAALDKMPLVDSTINETLRLHGTGVLGRRTGSEAVPVLSAKSTLPGRVGEVIEVRDLPAHTQIATPLSQIFLDERRFANPLQFKADRFVGKKEDTAVVESLFGGGQHLCPGRFFVRNELRAFLAALCMRFDMTCARDTPPKQRVDELNNIMQMPIEDADVVFTPRKN